MNSTTITIPASADAYQIRAFFDEDDLTDLPLLLLETGETVGKGVFAYFREQTELKLRPSVEMTPADARAFWERMKEACDVALARIEVVESTVTA